MTRTSRIFVMFAVGAAFACIAWVSLAGQNQAQIRLPIDNSSAASATNLDRTVGTSGCLAAACHGGSASEALTGTINATTWQSSATCWIANDPHSRTYSLLTEHPDRPVRVTAKEMMARLGSATPAFEDTRCLACHTNPALATPAATHDDRLLALRSEGVGCEGCHGNAGGWLREHTTWNRDQLGLYAQSGMVPLNDPGERAVACMGCHVGAAADESRKFPVRDMNHDMIAAGHPRLNYDFAEYHRRLPKHWQEKQRTGNEANSRGSKFEQRLWMLGRIAQAEVACKLLADRAERASRNDARTPWPEFADYNCSACHHDIPQPWRNDPSRLGTRHAGSLPWQTIWPLTDSTSTALGFDELKKLTSLMQGNRPPGFKRVMEPAHDAAASLTELRRQVGTFSDDEVTRMARRSFPERVPLHTEGDLPGQILLGLAAMRRSGALERANDADFEFAFESVKVKNWSEVRMVLDVLLGEMQPSP